MVAAPPIATEMMEHRLDAITLTLDQCPGNRTRETLRGLTSRLEAMSYDLAIAVMESDRFFAGTQEERTVWGSIRALDWHVDRLERHCSDVPTDELWPDVENAYRKALDVFTILLYRNKSAPITP